MPNPQHEQGGWHSRHYLPHFDQPGQIQAITFRLADALPAEALASLQYDQQAPHGPAWRQRLEAYLDAGHGSCYLRATSIAQAVENALLHFERERYHLLAWVVMPNHVHAVVEMLPGYSLSSVVHFWKSFTAQEANKLLGRTGRFWQTEYYDRMIRDERHLASAVAYALDNPVKAGLVSHREAWPFSSAAKSERA